MAPPQRRLSAVLHSDLTGFVRLMEADEAGTVEALKAAQLDGAFIDAGEHRLKNVSRPVQIYHVKAAEHASVRTTSSIVPRTTLRFHGADEEGHTFVLDVALEKLIATRSGLVIGRDSDQC